MTSRVAAFAVVSAIAAVTLGPLFAQKANARGTGGGIGSPFKARSDRDLIGEFCLRPEAVFRNLDLLPETSAEKAITDDEPSAINPDLRAFWKLSGMVVCYEVESG